MTSPARRLLAALAILAVGASQVWGLTRGWVCFHSGEAIVVSAPDCLSAGCHLEDADEDHHPDEENHEHDQLTQAMLGRAFLPIALELPSLVEFSLPPLFEWKPRLLFEEVISAPGPPPTGCGPPLSVLVARTVVRQV
jgi:hypothetical protein